MSGQRATGDGFEIAAERHLQTAGLIVLARNVTCRHGELDLVMQDQEVVVFVEVRYRRSAGFGGALASVDAHKQRRLIATAAFYLQTHPTQARRPCRFDVIAIAGEIENPRIEWIKDAFRVDG